MKKLKKCWALFCNLEWTPTQDSADLYVLHQHEDPLEAISALNVRFFILELQENWLRPNPSSFCFRNFLLASKSKIVYTFSQFLQLEKTDWKIISFGNLLLAFPFFPIQSSLVDKVEPTVFSEEVYLSILKNMLWFLQDEMPVFAASKKKEE